MKKCYVGLDLHKATIAARLYDLIKPLVAELVCNPRRNHLLKVGSKSDKDVLG